MITMNCSHKTCVLVIIILASSGWIFSASWYIKTPITGKNLGIWTEIDQNREYVALQSFVSKKPFENFTNMNVTPSTVVYDATLLSAKTGLPLNFIKGQPAHVVNIYKQFFIQAKTKGSLVIYRNCPVSGFITGDTVGRLGNHMIQYASLYAAARKAKLIPVIDTEKKKVLNTYFTRIGLVTYEDFGFQCPLEARTETNYAKFFRTLSVEYQMRENVRLVGLLNWVSGFHKYRNELLDQFQFRPEYIQAAEERLNRINKEKRNVTFIGIHIRRDDNTFRLRKKRLNELGMVYLKRAMDVYKREYPNAVFLAITDSIPSVKEMLQNNTSVHLIGDGKLGNPGNDLATMVMCNHSIITHGSFSFWAAYLKKTGETIAPRPDIRHIEPIVGFRRVKAY